MNNVILKQIKRVLSVVLAIVLIVGLIPRSAYSVYAQEVADEQTENSDYDESVELEILDEQGEAEELTDVSEISAEEDAKDTEIAEDAVISENADGTDNTENIEDEGAEETEESKTEEELDYEEDILDSDEMELTAGTWMNVKATIEKNYGNYGRYKEFEVEEDFENDVMSVCFKLSTNYKDIAVASNEELWLFYKYGAYRPIVGNRDNPDSLGDSINCYRITGGKQINQNSDEEIIKIETFNPREEYKENLSIGLEYGIISKADHDKDVTYLMKHTIRYGEMILKEYPIEYTPSIAANYFITFNANGGVFNSQDGKAVKSKKSSGTATTYTEQTFRYKSVSDDEYIADINAASVYDFAPVREGYTFAGWESENDGSDYPEYFSSKE